MVVLKARVVQPRANLFEDFFFCMRETEGNWKFVAIYRYGIIENKRWLSLTLASDEPSAFERFSLSL